MWRQANERRITEPRPFAVIEGDAERVLLIRYSNGSEELYATVPLTRDGCPVEPFAYTGDKRRPEQIVEALPPAQRTALAATRFSLHDEEWVRELEANRRFRRLNWQTDGTSVPHDGRYDSEDRERKNCSCCADVRVRAVRFARPWTESESAAMPLPVSTPIEYPSDACVLVLPYAQPRPEGDRRSAQWRAAFLTPVTVVGDAAMIALVPVFYVWGFATGEWL